MKPPSRPFKQAARYVRPQPAKCCTDIAGVCITLSPAHAASNQPDTETSATPYPGRLIFRVSTQPHHPRPKSTLPQEIDRTHLRPSAGSAPTIDGDLDSCAARLTDHKQQAHRCPVAGNRRPEEARYADVSTDPP